MKVRKKCGKIFRGISCIMILGLMCSFSMVRSEREVSAISGLSHSKAANSLDLSVKGAGYTSILYDNSNGLSTSEANAVAQTSDGFIWVGAYSGLMRYDGKDFFTYDSSYGISSVVSLFVDSKDRLWVGTNESGVLVYENGKFKKFDKAEGMQSMSIRSIAEDDKGNILLATTSGMAYVSSEDSKLHAIDDPQVNNEYVNELKIGENGVIYGDTASGSFFIIKELRVHGFYNGAEHGIGMVKCVEPDVANPDCVYIGTRNSEIIHCDLSNGVKVKSKNSNLPVQTINFLKYIEGKLWICSDNGISYIDKNGKCSKIEDVQMNNSVDSVMADYEGNLWFVSSRQGVLKIVANQFDDVSDMAELENMVVNTTCMYEGRLYIGTDEGLELLDKNYNKVENKLTRQLKNIRIRAIKTDSANNLWICTYGDQGLVKYNEKKGTYKNITVKDGLSSVKLRTIIELNNGDIGVAESGGFDIISNDKVVKSFNQKNGVANPEILGVCQDKDGAIYLGSDGDGIYKIVDGSVNRIGMQDGLKSEVVLRVKKDPDSDIIWIITSNSLAYMDNGKVKTISNFPYSNNFDLFCDKLNRVWVMSSHGIYVVSKDDLLKNKKNMNYTLYDRNSGLEYVTTANSRSYIGASGNLYICGSTGVASVNINDNVEDVSKLKISVPFIVVDDKEIYVGDKKTITIPSDAKRLTIYSFVHTNSLINPNVNYMLKGFDSRKIYSTKQQLKPVSYTNLAGGKYTFHFGINSSTTNKEFNSIDLQIVKKKAIYESIWFMLLSLFIMISIVVGIVYLIFRRKTRALEKKKEEDRVFINQIIQAFAKCIDMKDKYTNGHSFRVAKYTKMFAEKMGYSGDELETIYNTALLHDIGKISIPDDILGKPGRLTDEEFAIIKSHASNGFEILRGVELLPGLALGAGCHHEKIDGTGYPRGLKDEEIPKVAKIIAVADTFDAMYSNRPYRKQMLLSDVVKEVKRVAGTQLSPEVVEVFVELAESGVFDDVRFETAEDAENE
ncbi:HD domain-containing phosphohydrolase [Eubacterium xylanophilum]|uniref:HD domain-containing phosphohydrolase n=1 Tax=Eubacterium xylanophilum TaxID=39497 RepID=UPI0004BB017D|nr:HD domain-containing phosphohydrolase [Eubacterium xylanophilum]